MFSRTRRMMRRRRFFTGLALGFATIGVFAGTASAKPLALNEVDQQYYQARYGTSQHQAQQLPLASTGKLPRALYEQQQMAQQLPLASSGRMPRALYEQHLINEQRAVKLANGEPNYSHLPSEDRAAIFAPKPQSPAKTATATASNGFELGDWMRGIALATLLVFASAIAVIMVRGGVRTAHS
jgi:hypothetical protein